MLIGELPQSNEEELSCGVLVGGRGFAVKCIPRQTTREELKEALKNTCVNVALWGSSITRRAPGTLTRGWLGDRNNILKSSYSMITPQQPCNFPHIALKIATLSNQLLTF